MKNKTLVIAFIAIISFAMAGCSSGGAGSTTGGGGGVGIEMVKVPSGSFDMGKELGVGSDETNVHTVTLTAFSIGKYEVTQDQYRAVMGNNSSNLKGDNLPVEQVSWYDAIEFCNALSEKEGLSKYYTINKTTQDTNNTSASDTLKWTVIVNSSANGYRLPTEAQWEYAAKGGNTGETFTYSGSYNADEVAWHSDNSGSTTHPVGTKNPNGLGVIAKT